LNSGSRITLWCGSIVVKKGQSIGLVGMEKSKLYSNVALVSKEWCFGVADLHIAISAGSLVASQAHSFLKKLIDTSSLFLG
jgi:hypothetical protein